MCSELRSESLLSSEHAGTGCGHPTHTPQQNVTAGAGRNAPPEHFRVAVQTPAEQGTPVAHLLPQVPQLLGSVAVLTQDEPHRVKEAANG